jgi:hypothetical protein
MKKTSLIQRIGRNHTWRERIDKNQCDTWVLCLFERSQIIRYSCVNVENNSFDFNRKSDESSHGINRKKLRSYLTEHGWRRAFSSRRMPFFSSKDGDTWGFVGKGQRSGRLRLSFFFVAPAVEIPPCYSGVEAEKSQAAAPAREYRE